MSDLSRTREARRALKTFLRARALTGEPVQGPVISRRFSPRPGQGVVELTESDIRALLRAEKEARRVAARAIHEKLCLQRKNATYVQRLKDWDALSPVTLSAWENLQRRHTAALRALSRRARDAAAQHNEVSALRTQIRNLQDLLREQDAPSALREENRTLRNTVAELSHKIQDPPGSHERWQELRSSLARAEHRIRTQALAIEALSTGKRAAERERDEAHAAREETDSYKEALEKALRAVRADLREARDRRDPPGSRQAAQATEIRRLRTELEDLHKDKARAQQTVRDMADQLLALPTPGQYAQLKKTLSDCQQELQSLPTREMIDAASKATRGLRADLRAAREALDVASAEAKNQRAEKVTAQRGWAEVRKELDTLRAAPGTVNYRGLYEEAVARGKKFETELQTERLRRARDLTVVEKQRDQLRTELADAARLRFTSTPGGLSAEDLARVAQDLLPQFLATFLPRPKDKL